MKVLGIRPYDSSKLGVNTVVDFTINGKLESFNHYGPIVDCKDSEENQYTYLIGDNGCGKTGILDYIANNYRNSRRKAAIDKDGNKTVVPNVYYVSPYASKRNNNQHLTIFNPFEHSCTIQFLYFLYFKYLKPESLEELEKKLGKKINSIQLRKYHRWTEGVEKEYEKNAHASISQTLEDYKKKHLFKEIQINHKHNGFIKKFNLEDFMKSKVCKVILGEDTDLQLNEENFKTELGFALIAHGSQADEKSQMIDIEVRVEDNNNGGYYLGHASAGEKLIVKLFSMFSRCPHHKDAIFLFDEPETSLHPKWQLEFPEMLRMVAEDIYGIKKSHFIFATHSPLIIMQSKSIQNHQVINLWRDEKGALRSEILENDDIDKFSVDRLLLDTFQVKYLEDQKEKEFVEKITKYANDKQVRFKDDQSPTDVILGSYEIKEKVNKAFDELIKMN